MKHLYPALLATLLPATLTAQIEITSADMPVIGDELVRLVDTLPAFGPGASGPAQTWDFSGALEGQTTTNSIVDPVTTPSADQFAGSTLAMTTDGTNFFYLTNAPDGLTMDGFSGDPLGDGSLLIDAPFAPTMSLHQFPRQYTTAFTDDFGFDVTADGSAFGVYQARIKEVGLVHDTTDAYGTITTPVGTYDCLRSRLVTIRTDSIWAQILQILPFNLVQTSVDTTITYVWHAVETKLPVAEMTVDGAGNATDFTWSAIEPNSTGLISAPTEAGDISLFPQPAADHVRIAVPGAAWISVIVSDLDGRVVLKNQRLAANDLLDLSALPAGVYVVNATDDHGQRSSRRLVHVTVR